MSKDTVFLKYLVTFASQKHELFLGIYRFFDIRYDTLKGYKRELKKFHPETNCCSEDENTFSGLKKNENSNALCEK